MYSHKLHILPDTPTHLGTLLHLTVSQDTATIVGPEGAVAMEVHLHQ